MKNKDAFAGLHPAVNFLYFVLVLTAAMALKHPVCLMISFLSALFYGFRLTGGKAVRFTVSFALPMMLLAALFNVLFNHEGVTPLIWLPSGNAVTLESLVYGLFASLLLMTVLTWFYCCNQIMTTDKFVYLFGKIIPALSLVMSMTLRFIPRFKEQTDMAREARRCLNGKMQDESSVRKSLFINKVNKMARGTSEGVTVLSAVITWALENAIETSDSMQCRGYGLKGRTFFSVYHFDSRDLKTTIWLITSTALVIYGKLNKILYFRYYPGIKGAPASISMICIFAVYAALCLTPVIIDQFEDCVWKSLQSKI